VGLLHWSIEGSRQARPGDAYNRIPSLVASPVGLRRFPAAAIVVAVRWYLRYALSYRDVEELLVERGIAVDHVTVSPGSTIHTAAGRRRPVHLPRTGRSLVDIRDVGEDF
jgi:hypothetical protein